MCQYTTRCPTDTHRPGTVCKVAGRRTPGAATFAPPPGPVRRPARNSAPSRSTRPAGRSGASSSGHRQTAATLTAGASGADTIALWVWLAFIWNERVDSTFVVAALVTVGIPVALAGYWLSTCSAWLNDGSRRCRQPRTGLLRRCRAHTNQTVTAYDLAGATAAVLAVVNTVMLIAFTTS